MDVNSQLEIYSKVCYISPTSPANGSPSCLILRNRFLHLNNSGIGAGKWSKRLCCHAKMFNFRIFEMQIVFLNFMSAFANSLERMSFKNNIIFSSMHSFAR